MGNRFDLVKDYALEPVPQHERKGWIKLTFVWMGGIVALSAIVLGGTLGAGLPLSQAVIASFIGSFILAVLSALCSIVGAKTGLSTALVSRFALGKYGSYAVSVIIALALFGWFGVQLDLFGASLHNVLINGLNINIPPLILVLIGGVLMTTTALVGYKAIEKLSLLAVPLLAILLVSSLIKVMSDKSMGEITKAPITGDAMTMGSAISLIIGSLAIGAIIGPDISRYARSTKDAVISSFMGYFAGFSIVLIIAAILAKATTQSDIVEIMLSLGWGTAALLVLILAQWTTNDNNLYSSALGFSVIFQRIPKPVLSVMAGAIGTGMAVAGIYDNFIPFLNFLSAFIPPIGGIYVAEFIVNREKFKYENIGKTKNVEAIAIGVWAIATLIAFMTMAAPNGFGLFKLTGASGFDAFLIAFGLQLVMGKLFSSKNKAFDTTPYAKGGKVS
ncbi:cytosine permease [Virgibacillus sp. JSM 102003]|uniref:cytosine permease n=1 Tax=Virgibacillus sp. JSM 102003 TaxID=1562108 RepID=UPI0035BF141E